MDWKRAKNILILTFIILNVCLSVILYNIYRVEEVSDETIRNTRKILELNNVRIECPIPKQIVEDQMLQYAEQELNRSDILKWLFGATYKNSGIGRYVNGSKVLEFKTAFNFIYTDNTAKVDVSKITNKDSADAFVKSFFKDSCVPFDTEFVLDGHYPAIKEGDSIKIMYKGVYKGHSVFDNYIHVQIDDEGALTVEYSYKKPLKITPSKQNVSPAFEILINRMTKEPGIDITQVDIGFKGYTFVEDTKTLYEGLAWRIVTSNGDEYYFNARNGDDILAKATTEETSK